jgi:hypothetical protein
MRAPCIAIATVILALTFMTSEFAMVQSAIAKPLPSFVKEGHAYRSYRAKLKKQGWKPIGTSLRADGGCPKDDPRCSEFPEARECSETGLGYCNMVWRHRDGTTLIILTGGEGDNSPQVVSVSKGP